MSETVNQGTNGNGTQEGSQESVGTQAAASQEKTFTQAEVNEILKERLSERKSKYSDYEELKKKAEEYDRLQENSKTELQKATEKAAKLQAELDNMKKEASVKDIRAKVSKETGVPDNLLTGKTEEDCKAQAEAIKAYADPGYPNLTDKGEAGSGGGTSTRDQFANWANGIL